MKTMQKKLLTLILSMMLIVAMAFTTTGCNANTNETESGSSAEAPGTENKDSEDNKTVLGEGETIFLFEVVDKDGAKTTFEIHTDKKMVGEALLDLKLIEGETSTYGLYVKVVNGIKADYDVDKTYWAFYVDGAYASAGVDATEIVAGSTYTFKVEK